MFHHENRDVWMSLLASENMQAQWTLDTGATETAWAIKPVSRTSLSRWRTYSIIV